MSRYLAIIALLTLAGCATVLAPIQRAKGHIAATGAADADAARAIFTLSGNAAGIGCSDWAKSVADQQAKIAAMPIKGVLSTAAAIDAQERALKQPGFQACVQLGIDNPLFMPAVNAVMRALAVLP